MNKFTFEDFDCVLKGNTFDWICEEIKDSVGDMVLTFSGVGSLSLYFATDFEKTLKDVSKNFPPRVKRVLCSNADEVESFESFGELFRKVAEFNFEIVKDLNEIPLRFENCGNYIRIRLMCF